jgi:hypothetical protein
MLPRLICLYYLIRYSLQQTINVNVTVGDKNNTLDKNATTASVDNIKVQIELTPPPVQNNTPKYDITANVIASINNETNSQTPKLVTINFASTLNAIELKFDGNIYGNRDCAALFDSRTIVKIGIQPECTYRFDKKQLNK